MFAIDRILSAHQELFRFLNDMDIHKMYYMEDEIREAKGCLVRCIDRYNEEKKYRKERVLGSEAWEQEKSIQVERRLSSIERGVR